jgi:nucleoside-diphosphate-sugar epimerase
VVQGKDVVVRTLQNSRVLITGAGGFLAGHIIPKLVEKGAEVIGLDVRNGLDLLKRKERVWKLKLVEGDISKHKDLERVDDRCDYVIHLAAIAAPLQCEKNPEMAFLTNVQGTFNVLKLAQNKEAKKVLFSSSAHVYGISPKYVPTDENHPLALQDIYTTSKILGESLCSLFYSNHHLEYITTRLYNAYGPGQNTDYFIPAMIAKAKGGRIELKGRHITKDFVYVDDVADAFILALQSDYVGEINIGSGKQTTLEYVASYIAKNLGAEMTFSTVEPGGPTHMQCDPTRAHKVLGWRAQTPLEQGLDKAIAASK